MMMTKEDVLRELELLPAWKLRAANPASQAPAQEKAEVPVTVAASVVLQPTYQVVISADQTWGFVWLSETALSEEAKLLFGNICLALNIVKTNQKLLDDATTFSPAICVIFGEATAQSWLKTSDNLANLRGQLHQVNNPQIVVTHHLHDVLITPALKREVWQDLCFARNVLTPK